MSAPSSRPRPLLPGVLPGVLPGALAGLLAGAFEGDLRAGSSFRVFLALVLEDGGVRLAFLAEGAADAGDGVATGAASAALAPRRGYRGDADSNQQHDSTTQCNAYLRDC